MATREIIAAVFVSSHGQFVAIETSLQSRECYEEALRRICRAVCPELVLSGSICHTVDTIWGVYQLMPEQSSIFHPELWNHPTIACAPIMDHIPAYIRRQLLKAH